MKATLARLNRLTTDPLATGDGPLLDAFLAGDQHAFAILVRRHAGLVFATCRRVLRHQQDAEDAFQATFLVLARRAADVWPREAVGSWLFGVAHRVALKARAVRCRRAVREQPLEDLARPESPRPECDLAEVVQRVVCKLPEVYRAAVVACDLEGLSRKEAAERLGWSEGTLSGRLARARALLANRLRRLGLSLPAAGLAGIVSTSETVSATTLQSTIKLTSGGAGAPAPVAALTEGVVRSMTLFKLKAMVAVVFAACAVGFGAFAATGNGADSGDGSAQQKQAQTQGAPPAPVAANAADPPKPAPPVPAPPAASKGPRVGLAQHELELLARELAIAGKGKIDPALAERLVARISIISRLLNPDGGTGDPPAKPLNEKPSAVLLSDRDRLQGSWRVVALTEAGKTTLTNPKDPWVIEFTGGKMRMPFRELDGDWKMREYSFSVEEGKTPRTIDLIAPNKPLGRGIYEFTGSEKMCSSCHEHPFKADAEKLPVRVWGFCAPALKNAKAMREANLRLALSIDGKRPAKFGGDGVIVFELTRPDLQDDERAKLTTATKRAAEALRAAKDEKEKQRLTAELAVMEERLRELELLKAQQRAQAELRRAESDVERARALVLVAQADAERATLALQTAKQRVAEAEKALAALKKPKAQPPGDAAFTVHIRTLRAAEKVIRVKSTGKETVLEALVYAADEIPVITGSVSVWLVRDKAVLPVDIPAITQKGDSKTNYTLKPGDQLFLQAKPDK